MTAETRTTATVIERYLLADDGLVPNNPRLPLHIYRAALPHAAQDAAQRIIHLFLANGWDQAWINGIYAFHHYHATAHEVLGLARGRASVQFGGAAGPVIALEAGDAVLIPAGVGHCALSLGSDASVVGAYPEGTGDYDTQRATAEAYAWSLPRITRVADPKLDPVTGAVWSPVD